MIFGVAIGAGFGLLAGNMFIGAGVGAGIGLVLGSIVSAAKRKNPDV
jgi:hypothetical protein